MTGAPLLHRREFAPHLQQFAPRFLQFVGARLELAFEFVTALGERLLRSLP